MISPPKQLDKIQPNLVFGVRVTHMNGASNGNFIFGPAPLGTGEGTRGQISINFNYKVNLKNLYTKLCVCYKTYQTGF